MKLLSGDSNPPQQVLLYDFTHIWAEGVEEKRGGMWVWSGLPTKQDILEMDSFVRNRWDLVLNFWDT